MPNRILNNIEHQSLTVDTRPLAEYGAHVNRVLALSAEFADLHKEFPILLQRNGKTGEIQAHAILGLDKDENLFIDDNRWHTNYVPAVVARGPFSIGLQRREQNGSEVVEPVIMVDEDNPRIKGDQGVDVFTGVGGEAAYLQNVKRVLQVIDTGLKMDKVLYSLLQEFDLLEPVKITISLDADTHYKFISYYTVTEEKIATLSGDALARFNALGLLGPIFFLLSSLGNFQQLIDLKRAR